MTGDPYPKVLQLARPGRRYRRKVASPKQWAAIRTEKAEGQPCRVCLTVSEPLHLHYLIPRDQGGDDTADNIAPLCPLCHMLVTVLDVEARAILAANLTDHEYAHIIGKLGEQGMTRLFGVLTDPKETA